MAWRRGRDVRRELPLLDPRQAPFASAFSRRRRARSRRCRAPPSSSLRRATCAPGSVRRGGSSGTCAPLSRAASCATSRPTPRGPWCRVGSGRCTQTCLAGMKCPSWSS
eukprot:2298066-Prymnesium_polylepis.1